MENTFHTIRIAESKQDGEILQKILESITTEQLNKYLDFDPDSILLQRVIENFDQRRKYPHLVIGLFDSPNVDTSRLIINHEHKRNGLTPLKVAA